jgi:predicted transposase/invertase (TIGR01784 family)
MEKQDYVKSLMEYPSVHEMVECERNEAKEEGIQIGIQIGIEQGMQQGETNTKRILVRNMLAKGFEPAIVAEIACLTESEVLELVAEQADIPHP